MSTVDRSMSEMGVILSTRETRDMASVVDQAARGRGISRSRFISEAIRQVLHEPDVESYRELDEWLRSLMSFCHEPLMSQVNLLHKELTFAQQRIDEVVTAMEQAHKATMQHNTELFNEGLMYYQQLKFIVFLNLGIGGLCLVLLFIHFYFLYLSCDLFLRL